MDHLKRYRYFIVGGAVLLAALIGFLVWYRMQTPEVVLNAFIEAMNDRDYEAAYDEQLSDAAKADTDRQYFIDRYTNIYGSINAQNIAIYDLAYGDNTSESGGRQADFVLEMDTIAGHYTAQAVARFDRQGLEWKLTWDEGLILPGMHADDRVSVMTTAAERGSLYDRNGTLLAGIGPATEVGIVPGKLNAATREADLQTVAGILGITVDTINAALSQSWVTDDVRVPIATIDVNDTTRQDSLLTVPGIYTDITEKRTYPLGEKAAHLTGYVQGITAEELEEKHSQGDYTYSETSVIGRTGLEAAYEDRLHGKNGYTVQVECGANGNPDGAATAGQWTVIASLPENGRDVTVTIDASLQTRFYDQFAGDKSASVAMNPKTGEVLALVSTPSYDPNAFIDGISDERWSALNNDPNLPLVNRFEGAFAPGSSFKPLVAAVGMTAGALDPNADFGPSGTSWQKDSSWGDLQITTLETYSGPANLANALIYSDNIYFAKAALQIGGDTLKDGLNKAGFGQPVDFPLALTVSQVSNSGSFSDEGQLAQSGYGQGEVLVNPVHMAAVYSAFVNNGSMVRPVLEYSGEPQMLYPDVFTPEAAETLRTDLIQVVENPDGTAHEADIEGLVLAGKTGTAEIKASQDDTTGTENGWFDAFTADPNNPSPLMVVSMVEDVKDRGGSHYLVPKVKSLFES